MAAAGIVQKLCGPYGSSPFSGVHGQPWIGGGAYGGALMKVLDRLPPSARDNLSFVALSTLVLVLSVSYLLPHILKTARERPPPLQEVRLPTCPEPAQRGWKPAEILEKPSIVASGERQRGDEQIIVAYCPATGAKLGAIAADSRASIDDKVQRAQRAQQAAGWGAGSADSWRRRRRVLRTIKAWLVRDMDAIARVACRDTGKTCVDAVLGEVLTTLAKIEWLVSYGETVLRPEQRPNNLLLAHKRCTVYHEPLGVVTALVSWNYPCHNLLSPVLAALTAGNAIIVKCSEMVVWSSQYYMEGIQACLRACGESPDLVQLVCCFPPVAPALTSHPDVRHLTFIGSEIVARYVANDAAKAMTPCCLELGGKDPMIVLEDASLDFFVQTWLRAAFGSAGQNCIGAERFIVARSIVDRLTELVLPRVNSLRQGSFLDDVVKQDKRSGIDIGAMISDNRFDTLEELIAEAKGKGARVLAGGSRYKHPRHPTGHYFAPTFIIDVTPDMRIAQEELFAPVFLVMTFDTVDEAIQLANGTRFGLGSSVFGANRQTCRRVASQLSCGMVNINDFAVSYLNQGLPFGGNKASGNSQRFGGSEGLLSLTATKAVTEDRLFALIKTAIPAPVHYPHADAEKAYAFVRSLATFFGADSWPTSIGGLAQLVRNSL